MYTQILVPLDESKLAERVLPYAVLLARVFQSRIELLRVMEPLPPATKGDLGGVYASQFRAVMSRQAQVYLEGVATTLKEDGLSASVVAQRGNPASCIVRTAEKKPDTLITMASRGRSGILRLVLGSVTDKVLRSTRSPLLLIRPCEQKEPNLEVKLESVVVPLDGSHLAEQVLPHIVAIAKALALTVILVRVTPADPFTPPSRHYAKRTEQDAQAVEYLHGVKQDLFKKGLDSVEPLLIHGNPADGILDTARKTPNCLVAMATHGRSLLGRWMLGSVTCRVVHGSRIPILVVRK